MAKNQGSEGAGQSKFRTAEQDAADRRAAQLRKKRGRRGQGGTDFRTGGGATLLDGIHQDRLERRQEQQERREQQRAAAIEKAYSTTLDHLTRFGEKMIPDKDGTTAPRWTSNMIFAAAELLRLYFYGSTEEIVECEARTSKRILDEVRRRFAGACFFTRELKGNPGNQDRPGQQLEWFETAFEAAARFHTQRKEARRIEHQLDKLASEPEKATKTDETLVAA